MKRNHSRVKKTKIASVNVVSESFKTGWQLTEHNHCLNSGWPVGASLAVQTVQTHIQAPLTCLERKHNLCFDCRQRDGSRGKLERGHKVTRCRAQSEQIIKIMEFSGRLGSSSLARTDDWN